MKEQASTPHHPSRLPKSARCGRASLLAVLSCWLYLVSPGVTSLAAQQITYTALGDSLAFGAFAPLGQGYVPLYRDGLAGATGRRVVLYNLGVPGWTSQDLRQALERNFLFQLLVWSSEAVTVNIGGNDLRAARTAYQTQSCGPGDNQDCLRSGRRYLQTKLGRNHRPNSTAERFPKNADQDDGYLQPLRRRR